MKTSTNFVYNGELRGELCVQTRFLQVLDNKATLKQMGHTHVCYTHRIFPSVKLDYYFNNERDEVVFSDIDDTDNFKRDKCIVLRFQYISEYDT